MHILNVGTSFWLPIWRYRAEKSLPYPPKLSLPFFFYLLLKKMRPIVGNFCATLYASMVTLTEINAFNLPLWYIWDSTQQPVGSSWPYKLLCEKIHSACLYFGLTCKTLTEPWKEQGGEGAGSQPLFHGCPSAEKKKWDKLKYRTRQAQKTGIYHLSKQPILSSPTVFSSLKKSLPFKAKFPIYGIM